MRVTHAIFPGFLLGCVCLIVVARLIANPNYQQPVAPPPAAAAINIPFVLSLSGHEEQQPTAQPQSDQSAAQSEADAAQPVENCQISASYPQSIQQWCGWISQYAVQQGVEPNLIAAVMLQESGGNPDAYSKSGAVGLMQVMPRDGLAASFQCINGPCFAARPSMAELYDPEFNIEYGTRMLAGLINRNGSARDGLRAYGPMNMGYRYADIVLNIYQQHP